MATPVDTSQQQFQRLKVSAMWVDVCRLDLG